MVCEVNGDYAPDQYQDNGLTYCIDEEGNKIGETPIGVVNSAYI